MRLIVASILLCAATLVVAAPWAVQLNAGTAARRVQHHSLTSVRHWNRVTIDKAASIHSALNQLQAGTESKQCLDAIAAFGKVLGIEDTTGSEESSEESAPPPGSCLAKMQNLWDYNETSLPTQASIGSWCKDCAVPLGTSLDNLLVACGDNEEALAAFSQIKKFFAIVLDLPCLLIDDTYCLPVFLKSQAEFRKLGDNVTAAQLDGVCNLCNQAYVNLIREFATDFQDAGGSLPDPDVESFGPSKLRLASEGGVDIQDDVPFDALCLQINGKYCVVEFNKMQGETETNRTQQIEDLCDPCTRFFVNKKLDTITDGKTSDEYKEFARFVESLPAVCAKNANGQRCGLLADENAAGTSPLTAIGNACESSSQSGGACSLACKNAISSFTTSAGCCSRSVFEFIELDDDDKTFNATKAIEFANVTCNLPLMEAVCLPAILETSDLSVTNIKPTYYSANEAAIRTAIKKDVAKTLGIGDDEVTVTAGAAASSVGRTGLLAWLFGTGPQIQATQNLNVGLKAYDTTEGKLLKTKLDKSKADGTLSTSNLGKAVPKNGKADPNKPFAGGNSLKFSGASSLSVSIMSVVLIIGTSIIALLV